MTEHQGIPADTLAPMVIAIGATFLLGGVIWSPIVSVVGLVLVALGIARWIDELWREAP